MSEQRDVTARGISKPSWLTKLERLAESSWTTWIVTTPDGAIVTTQTVRS